LTPDERCAQIFAALRALGVECLVMGGHAVRFYGIQRGTVDYDLAIEGTVWDGLPAILARGDALGRTIREGDSWRPEDFRRFVIGSLPDGREERVELWRRNHLLSPWRELHSRRRTGPYGGQDVDFLHLEDLIRSKETEREDDWRDIFLLEDVADEARIVRVDQDGWLPALSTLRGQKGFATASRRGAFTHREDVRAALARAGHPVTAAFLLPFVPDAKPGVGWSHWSPGAVEILERYVRLTTPGSNRHLALVEAIRRTYKQARMAEDRADKERSRQRREP
jgi:hypothetical protein